MTNKTKVIIACAALLAAYAFGRFSAPEKVKTEIKTVEVEKKAESTDANKHKETTQTTVTHKDGTTETVTKTVEDTSKKTKETDNLSLTQDKTKEIIYSSNPVNISVLTGSTLSFSSNPIIYGGMISRKIIGPVTIGIWGMSNRTGGFTLGLSL